MLDEINWFTKLTGSKIKINQLDLQIVVFDVENNNNRMDE
jgi:hypothetical protein